MPSGHSEPCLPPEFLRKILADPMMADFMQGSSSLFPEFHQVRLELMNTSITGSVDIPTVSHDNSPLSSYISQNKKRTYLHLAALIGDVIMGCKMVHLGATIDLLDGEGKTALFLAIETIVSCNMATSLNIGMPAGLDLAQFRLSQTSVTVMRANAVQRSNFLARVLLEQHADSNISCGGITPLHLASKAEEWELITLLLKHGAHPSPTSPQRSGITSPASLLPSAAARTRFLALVNSSKGPRLPRLCPCFSGLTLSACHKVGEKPYPPSFVCPCISGKLYRKCCSRRNLVMLERWNEQQQRILPAMLKPLPVAFPEGQAEKLQRTFDIMAGARDMCHTLGIPFKDPNQEELIEKYYEFQHNIADELGSKGLIDPAYAYALKQVDFMPRPQGRSLSKEDCRELQRQWNDAVDKYLALGVDKRLRSEIERAAKIGISNGALYRKCEGKDCDKEEGVNIVKLNICSKCKIAVYCSRACQSSVWKSHKEVCGNALQLEQALPSQIAIDAHSSHWKEIAEIDLTPPPKIEALMELSRKVKAQKNPR